MSTETLSLDLSRATANQHAKAIARGELSAVEATEAAIGRIEVLNGAINAVVVKDYDRAREQAMAADARRAKGDTAPLLGVPMTVKESYNIAGLPTTWGFEHNRNHAAADDALVIQRLKIAGAVILGKTNVPPALGDWQSVNPIYGRTVNPHDHGRSPGGSSGGGAAALASGMIPLEFGSDIGGSIRIPAAFCGVYGHKPTQGLIPMRGHAPPGAAGAGRELSVVGPLARSAADLDIALGVTAGPLPEDAVSYKLVLAAPRHKSIKDYRVLVLDHHPAAALDSEMRTAVNALAARLEEEGAKVSRASDLLPDLASAHGHYVSMLMTITTMGTPDARPIDAHAWMTLLDHRHLLRMQWAGLFETLDVVISPTFGTAAFPHDDTPSWGDRKLLIDNEATPYGAQLAWPGLATFPGLPATAMPIGMSRDGLPMGAQLIGPWMEDRTPIALAQMLEQ